MRLPRRPMAEDEFWSLIDVMGGECDDDAVARLTEQLQAQGRKGAVAFQERLARVLYELDREVLASQPIRYVDDPEGELIPLSDDGFLYVRAGIVARGRATVSLVLADPTTLSRGLWDECEELLYVADEVADDEIDTKVSYETGSNTQHWAPRVEPEREPWDQGRRLVWVDCQDLSDPVPGETYFPDGRTEVFVDYLPPTYVDRKLDEELTLTMARIVATNGGLPTAVGASRVTVVLEFADQWQLRPEVAPAERERDADDFTRAVRVSVSDAEARSWSPVVRREALLAVAALCVLAVLPDDHAARPELERIRDAGARHLPPAATS